jgi:hypothetical protein
MSFLKEHLNHTILSIMNSSLSQQDAFIPSPYPHCLNTFPSQVKSPKPRFLSEPHVSETPGTIHLCANLLWCKSVKLSKLSAAKIQRWDSHILAIPVQKGRNKQKKRSSCPQGIPKTNKKEK